MNCEFKNMIKRVIHILQLLLVLPFFVSSSHAQNSADSALAEYYFVKKGETLYDIASLFDLGFDELLHANPSITNPHLIYANKKIILPLTHLIPDVEPQGIAINLAELRLYLFTDDDVESFPISIGADEKTPTGKTKIIAKRENPSWTPPNSIREENPRLPEIVLPGPDNPLGNYALYLDASHDSKWQGIMVHGTNVPRSIGSKVSHGCIRLYPQDIEKLFNAIEISAPIIITNQPLKVSEIDDKIYLEVHLKEAPDVVFEDIGVSKLICQKIKNCEEKIDWQKVDDTVIENLGIPVEITKKIK